MHSRTTFSHAQEALSFSDLRLNEVNDQHAAHFANQNSDLSASTVNNGLRTLRRALSLAVQWGKLDRMPKITMAKGEKQRELVLTPDESRRYLEVCPQPWRDAATIMLGTGVRPCEVFHLRWEHLLLNGSGGLVSVVAGKSRAARRLIPMVPEVYTVLKDRHQAQGEPLEGWVFPSGSRFWTL